MVGFTNLVGLAIMESQMELSDVKRKRNASTDAFGKKLEAGLKRIKVTYEKKVKSLGAGLAGGRRRNTDVQKKRHRDFKNMIKKFRRLDKIGAKVDKRLRIGGAKAMTYGEGIMWVSDSMLRNQRRTTGTASSPAGGPGGQNLDMQLMLTDGGPKGKADPAVDAHELHIGQWVMAVWETWQPRCSMIRTVVVKLPILIRAPRPWSRVYGPAAAFIATCARLR